MATAITPDDDGPPSGSSLLAALAIGFGSALISALLVVGLASTLGTFSMLVGGLFDLAITSVVCWYFVCRAPRKTLRVGFRLERPSNLYLAIGIAIGVVGALAATYIARHFTSGSSMMAQLSKHPYGREVIILLSLLSPLVEEAYYRGFAFPVLRGKVGVRLAVLIVSTWFAGLHAFQLAGDWAILPVIVVVGTSWTILRQTSRSLVPSVLSHLAYNSTLAIVTYVR